MMASCDDLHLLAQRADQLSRLPAHERAARHEEAAAVLGAVVAVATPEGVARAKELLEARFGRQIRATGEAALTDPWWLFRRDDGRPPVILALVGSALARSRPSSSAAQLLAAWRLLQQRRGALALDVLRREVKRLLDTIAPQTGDAESFLRRAPAGWQQRMELLLTADPLVPDLIARSRPHG
jgi:hypothetical protein